MVKPPSEKGVMRKIELIPQVEIDRCIKGVSPLDETSTREFLNDFNQDIQELNSVIEQFNSAKTSEDKEYCLSLLQSLGKWIGEKYSDDYFVLPPKSDAPYYESKIEKELFLAIAEQRKHYPKPISSSPAVPWDAKQKLVTLIETMDPESLKTFCSELSEYKRANNDIEKEKRKPIQLSRTLPADLVQFFQENTVTFLNGSNSYNFLVRPLDGSPSFVIKLEDRMGMPKSAVRYLRTTRVEGALTKEYTDRTVTYVGHKGRTAFVPRLFAHRLVVTDYCKGADILTYSEKMEPTQRDLFGLTSFVQMAILFKKLQENNVCFPDSKSTNWLVENDILRIADTKSFLFTTGDRTATDGRNKGYGLITTAGFVPPELRKLENLPLASVEAIHAYILGKNINNFYSTKHLYTPPKIRAIVTRLMDPKPENRMKITEAIEQLLVLQKDALLEQIRNQGYPNDEAIRLFIENKTREFQTCGSYEERIKYIENLQSSLDVLRTHYVKEIFDPIFARLDKKNAPGKIAKIKEALSKIPLDQRHDLLDPEKNRELHEALAEHRDNRFFVFSQKKEFKRDPQGAIDNASAAQSFKNFKEIYVKKKLTLTAGDNASPLPSSPLRR